MAKTNLFKFFKNNLGTPYKLIFLNPDNLVEEYKMKLRPVRILVIFLVVFLLALAIGYFAPKLFQPKHAVTSDEIDQETVNELNNEITNLNNRVEDNDEYINNIQKILNGETPKLDEEIIEVKDTVIDSSEEEEIFEDMHGDHSEHASAGESNNAANHDESLNVNPSIKEQKAFKFYFTPLRGVVTNKFNPLKNHAAVDIQAQEGEPIKAIADGVVLFADWTSATGYVVMIQHSNDVISVYKHNSQVYKKIGDKVKMGEVIAAVGNTGELTTGPHLHFELWVNGHPEDPEKYLNFK